jgi:hypothetical protein
MSQAGPFSKSFSDSVDMNEAVVGQESVFLINEPAMKLLRRLQKLRSGEQLEEMILSLNLCTIQPCHCS